jgi:hypothetical protein
MTDACGRGGSRHLLSSAAPVCRWCDARCRCALQSAVPPEDGLARIPVTPGLELRLADLASECGAGHERFREPLECAHEVAAAVNGVTA